MVNPDCAISRSSGLERSLRAKQDCLNRADVAQLVNRTLELTGLEHVARGLRFGEPAEQFRSVVTLRPDHESVVRAEDDAEDDDEGQDNNGHVCPLTDDLHVLEHVSRQLDA